MKKSYMKSYFMKMLLLITILVGILAAAITAFSKKIAGQELISLHQSILNQSVRLSSETIYSLKDTMEKLAENMEVIEWISGHTEYEGQVNSFIQNEIFGSYKKGKKFRIFLYDMEGNRYSSDDTQVSWEEARQIIERSEHHPEASRHEEIWIEGPVINKNEEGLYRYGIYLLCPIRDHVNRKVQGYVLMYASETVLYEGFKNLISKNRDYCIVDGDGIVVSARNKQDIGKIYEKNDIIISDQGPLSSGYGISDQYKENVYFYENISGTEWYLLENADLRHIFASLNKTKTFTLLLVLIFAVCFIPVTFLSLRRILHPIASIKNKMNQVAEGDLKAKITEEEKGKGELSEIADSFNYMVEKLESQVEEIRHTEYKRHLLQLDFLQMQINPHFIYNTLSSIRFYVEMGKNEQAENMLIDFSKLLRKTLSSSAKFITLKEELDILEYYIDLQKARYRERFEVLFDIEEHTLVCIVPNFIMQPIVENAIFYSLKEKQMCHVWIRSYIEHENLCISIRDDGIGMDAKKVDQVLEKGMNMNKVGVRNVQERLELNYGESYGLRINSKEGEGTEVILVMPAEERKGDRDEDIDCR